MITIHLAAVLVGVLAFAATGAADPRPPIEVQGHRGARARYPENTLAGFAYALEVGVDVLELDVAVTRDDRLVVVHDLHINAKICLDSAGHSIEGEIPVRSLSLEEVKQYDCGTRQNPRFPRQLQVPGERIPTLDDVLDLIETSKASGVEKVRLNIEMKGVPGHAELTPAADAFAGMLHKLLAGRNMLSRVIVQSFDHRVLKAFKALSPETPVSVLMGETLPDLVAVARSAGAQVVSPHQDWVTAADVSALHKAGLRVVPWTANEPEQWERLVAMRVDGIISDDPAGLIKYLEERGAR